MKILITEDDFIARKLLVRQLSTIAEVDVAVNGKEAVTAAHLALNEGAHYDLICLDVMMPDLDGIRALRAIRQLEEKLGLSGDDRSRIFMTTGLSEKGKVLEAARSGCDAYLIKPITKARILEEMVKVGLVPPEMAQ
ncbi:response regulator [Desulfurivibrio sp. D14AmB]|uniref:response regulator n=1 Tax=Desulfurivibrio sp. D14AmB TaxID=3374370 RepID=UPI00376F194A